MKFSKSIFLLVLTCFSLNAFAGSKELRDLGGTATSCHFENSDTGLKINQIIRLEEDLFKDDREKSDTIVGEMITLFSLGSEKRLALRQEVDAGVSEVEKKEEPVVMVHTDLTEEIKSFFNIDVNYLNIFTDLIRGENVATIHFYQNLDPKNPGESVVLTGSCLF